MSDFLLWSHLKFTPNIKVDIAATDTTSLHNRIFKTTLGIITAFVTVYSTWGNRPVEAAVGPYCQFAPEEIAAKEKLLKASITDPTAISKYSFLVQKHTEMLQLCRSQTWPKEQAIWLRLYPCDTSPGSIDYVLDRIVNLGYNKIHLEVFYDSQVLLPPDDNPTPWTSVVRSPEGENSDLLQQTIDKAHQRGLKVYAWLFTMNFGYTYAQRPDRQEALARNGTGQDSLTFVHDRAQAFIDPYSRQAQTDYFELVQAVLERQPDGILFDYVRYPRGVGGQSSVYSVKDLWIYGKSSLEALYNRASNQKGLALIKKYVDRGDITTQDIKIIDRQYPQEDLAKWQGRNNFLDSKAPILSRQNSLRRDLWLFSVAHAAQGIIDFLSFAARPAQNRGIPAGAVFFPDANQLVGKAGFDSRLQAWDKFPSDLEWHPMAYAVCEEKTDCVIDQVKTVLNTASKNTKVIPALAGAWGEVYRQHPPLEVQMEALRKVTPQVNSVSHFSYAWQEPDRDRRRRSCNFL
ncbi:family 10 glycosylhydrolase [Pleurocapsales cyanobacterium LEGE 10410]|nr:family 10 glycosylhydrolase [Pleurocapsales cyanobacterium LEGE 10410]